MRVVIATILAALALIGVAITTIPARAVEPPVTATCQTVDQFITEYQAQMKPIKHLKGEEAAKMAKEMEADFVASDLLVYANEEMVMVVAFVDGCFHTAAYGSRELTKAKYPGLGL